MRCMFCFLIALISLQSGAQTETLKIGDWRSHLPYQQIKHLAQSDKALYIATPWSLVVRDKSDQSLSFISSLNGLSKVGIGIINYNPYNDMLLVTYDDNSFDLIFEDETVLVTDILTFSAVSGDKSINDIYFDDEAAFLSTAFGLIKLNTDRQEFEYTTFTGSASVHGFTSYKGFHYIATDDGLYRTEENNINPADFDNWELLDGVLGFPNNYSSNAIINYRDTLYFDVDGLVYRTDGNGWVDLFHESNGYQVSYMSADKTHLLMGFICRSNCVPGQMWAYKPGGPITKNGAECTGRVLYALEDDEGKIWYADNWQSMRVADGVGGTCEKISFNSPFSHKSTDIAVHDGKIYIASGGVSSSESALGNKDGVFIFDDGEWDFFSSFKHPELLTPESTTAANDMYQVEVDPSDGTVYIGTFYGGIISLDDNGYTVYNDQNSSLQGANGDDLRERVGGLTFDDEGNLWISNHLAENPISVRKNDGIWKNFSTDIGNCSGRRNLFDIDVDGLGYKWAVLGGNAGGVLVFDEGEIDNDFDQACKIFTASNSEIQTSKINCLEADLDGDIWVGTAEGVVIFECGSSVFDDNCQGSRRIVSENGFDNFLLVTEDVKAIAVDGANRKWFGTTNGVFVQSANGNEKVAFYNTDNSPLPDNNITAISINQENGEVFIGTNKGVVSVRAEAIEGGVINSPSAYAFPNPVRPNYDGPIAIKGLATNANVKITDIEGRMIYETTALGGQAIWDGRDYNGRKASSGVYLVFSTNTSNFDQAEAIVTKILFVN